MKLTGERPMQGATPDSLLAFHDAGYREVVARLGPGTVVDVGCGAGDETLRLAAPDRFLVGVDYSSETMRAAGRTHGHVPGVRFCATDGASLALRDASTDFVGVALISVHVTKPVAHVAELARVLRADGTAFVITPNAPSDFENPFHLHLVDRAALRALLEAGSYRAGLVRPSGPAQRQAERAQRQRPRPLHCGGLAQHALGFLQPAGDHQC